VPIDRGDHIAAGDPGTCRRAARVDGGNDDPMGAVRRGRNRPRAERIAKRAERAGRIRGLRAVDDLNAEERPAAEDEAGQVLVCGDLTGDDPDGVRLPGCLGQAEWTLSIC
jgi:hypothetical protein